LITDLQSQPLSGALTEERKVTGRAIKLEQTLNSLIEGGGYSRNRQPILDAVGVSAAALSQYARGHTRPSFQKLVALADFFHVSLDYLVWGDPVEGPVDPGPVAKYMEHALADVQARTSRHSDLVTRIGRVLADRVDEVAKALAESGTAGRGGLIEQDEVLRMERYCVNADIVTSDLSPNIIEMSGGNPAAGQFFHTLTSNIARGCTYRFLLTGELYIHSEVVVELRDMIASAVGGDRLNEYCSFRRSPFPMMAGGAVYHLDATMLATQDPGLFAQFGKYLLNGAWLGYLTRPNADANADMVMNPTHVDRACDAFEALWAASATSRVVA
jgi:transcriptional regulator with XRE-family HTH domain